MLASSGGYRPGSLAPDCTSCMIQARLNQVVDGSGICWIDDVSSTAPRLQYSVMKRCFELGKATAAKLVEKYG